MKKFFNNKASFYATVLVAVIVAAAVFAPFIATHKPSDQDLSERLAAPSASHLLGT